MSLQEHRQAVVAAVDGLGAQTFDHLPSRLSPPSVIVLPAEPYVTPGDVATTCQPYDVRHAVSLIVPPGSSDRISQQLDDLLDEVLAALTAAGIGIEQVSGFYEFEQQGASTFLACEITTTQPSDLEET